MTGVPAIGRSLGLVTIGQTPRPDFELVFRGVAPDAELRIAGALDGVGPGVVSALAAESRTAPFFARLASGEATEIPFSALEPLVSKRVVEMAPEVDHVVVLCAGRFTSLVGSPGVILPSQITPAIAGLFARRVGVVVPLVGQEPYALEKWRSDGFDPVVRTVTPSADREERQADLERVAGEFAGTDVELVILDCFSFDGDDTRTLARALGRPVLSAQEATLAIVGVLAAGCGRDVDVGLTVTRRGFSIQRHTQVVS